MLVPGAVAGPLAALILGLCLAGASCANGSQPSSFGPVADGGSDATADGTASGDAATGGAFGGDGAVSASTLLIQPADPTMAVTIANGVVTAAPVDFKAVADGTTVDATWQIDRGDLGAIDASGVFSASGVGTGVAHVTASYGKVMATTTVTVSVKTTQNGPPAVSLDAGVGGTGPGGTVTTGQQGALTGTATPPASTQELGWLYPYDKTVWPRGLLARLLQWQTTHSVTAVYIHLTEKYYEFQGFYSGTQLVNQKISGDGSTMFAEYSGGDSYSDGSSYNLQNGGSVIASYVYGVSSPDGTINDRKFVWSAVYPDGAFAMAGSNYAREAYFEGPSQLFARSNGSAIAVNGWDATTVASMPAFSADGTMLAFNFWSGNAMNGVGPGAGRSLDVMDFSCGQQNGSSTCGAPPYTFSNLREVYRDTTAKRYAGWPAFLPDGKSLVFHSSIAWDTSASDTCTSAPTSGTTENCMFTTWNGAQAELWTVDVPTTAGATTSPIALAQLNGAGYLPGNSSHPTDAVLNYEPTVNPIASGGYYWVVFTSRRMYGNVAPGDPYDSGDGSYPIPKKLWVAAIDIGGKPGVDTSHPAFYLPGQELNAGNMRGHWVVDPCKKDGASCQTGDECCDGFCRQAGDAGGLVCTGQPQGCSQEYEKCTTAADCCEASLGYQCLNGRCAAPSVQ